MVENMNLDTSLHVLWNNENFSCWYVTLHCGLQILLLTTVAAPWGGTGGFAPSPQIPKVGKNCQ